MPAKFKNNASATIAASITDSDTTIVLTTGFGNYFPTLTSGFYFFATLFNSSGESEITKVTARSGDTLTVVRAQDGTTAKAFTAGDGFALRVVSANLDNFVQIDGAQTITGSKTFSNPIIGNLTGDVLGNLVGNAATVTNGVYTTGAQDINGIKTFRSQVRVSGDGSANMYLSTFAGTSSYNVEQGWDDTGLFWDVGSLVRGFRWIKNGNTNLATLDSGGNFTNLGSITAAGDVTAYSDERLKSDIHTITDALAITQQLRGTTYVKDGKASIGVVAQEVQRVLPELVHEGSDGYLSVAYGNMVAVLIEAVKELNAKVEEMKGI